MFLVLIDATEIKALGLIQMYGVRDNKKVNFTFLKSLKEQL